MGPESPDLRLTETSEPAILSGLPPERWSFYDAMPEIYSASAPPDDRPRQEPTRRVVLLGVGGHWFGITIERVREVIPPRPYTPLPGSEAFVAGLINLRGRIVTVLDLGLRLNLRAAAAAADHSIVILDHAGRLVGMAVEEVSRIVEADLGALEVDPGLLRSLKIERSYLLGVGETEGRIFAAIDPDEIFRPVLT